MINSEKKLKELVLLLNDEDNTRISEGIELLRQEVPFEGAIAQLIRFYDKTGSATIRKSIELFMNDLKDQAAVKDVITELGKPWNPITIRMLVSSCWQSGLLYGEYCLGFVEIFLKGDYATAIECITVIEDAVPGLSSELKNEIIDLIQSNVQLQFDDKKVLTQELLTILDK